MAPASENKLQNLSLSSDDPWGNVGNTSPVKKPKDRGPKNFLKKGERNFNTI